MLHKINVRQFTFEGEVSLSTRSISVCRLFDHGVSFFLDPLEIFCLFVNSFVFMTISSSQHINTTYMVGFTVSACTTSMQDC